MEQRRRRTDPVTDQQLDMVDRRVKSQILTGIARAHLGRVPVNREWENVCPECRGDGCEPCNWTGYATPNTPSAVEEAAS
jgi:hypothetical protein